jgi:hypothetical protein
MAYIGVSPSNGVRQKHTYTATASQTTFSGAGSEGISLSYRDSNYVDVYRNGVKLGDADYTATSGTSIVLGEGAAVNDIVEIVVYDVFSVADTVSKADGGTFDGNVAMAGTLAVTGATTLSANLNLGDNNKAIFGAGSDLQIYHDGSGSFIEDVGTGFLKITSNGNGILLQKSSTETMAQFLTDGAVTLYHDNALKLATTSTGIDVTGVITTDGMTTSADINFGDNDKAVFGAGSDLQIYHDGSHSYIDDQGTGNIKYRAALRHQFENTDSSKIYMQLVGDTVGQEYVQLRYNNATKLATTSTGIDVTGVITTDGMTTSADINFGDNDKAIFGAGGDLQIYHDGTHSYIKDTGTGNLRFGCNVIQILNEDANETILDANQNGGVNLRYDNSVKISTTSTGIDVTGTVTADGLTVDGNILLETSGNPTITNKTTGAGNNPAYRLQANTNYWDMLGVFSDADDTIRFRYNNTDALKIANNGDISFFEDTGTTPKLFWDSSQEQLFLNGTIDNSTRPQIALDGGSGGSGRSAGISGLASGTNATSLLFFTNADTDIPRARMRIDSAGNLLVGKTSANPDTVGFEARQDGFTAHTRNASTVSYFDRTGNDGTIIQLLKDGSAVGSIGTQGGDLVIFSTTSNHKGLRFGNAQIIPVDNAGAISDNTTDLGGLGARFDDILQPMAQFQTSDQNEKNTITDSDLGIDFIKRLTPKSYIFNGKTRTHYGLIAQDVETVLSDISKPTSGFAGFIKDDISEEQDGSEYRYGLRYTEFVAPLIQAVKDQQATIDAQQTTITALEARITALENAE